MHHDLALHKLHKNTELKDIKCSLSKIIDFKADIASKIKGVHAKVDGFSEETGRKVGELRGEVDTLKEPVYTQIGKI